MHRAPGEPPEAVFNWRFKASRPLTSSAYARLASAFLEAASPRPPARRTITIMAAEVHSQSLVVKAVDPKELVHNDKTSSDYRDYTQGNSKFFDRVSDFYHKNHKYVLPTVPRILTHSEGCRRSNSTSRFASVTSSSISAP